VASVSAPSATSPPAPSSSAPSLPTVPCWTANGYRGEVVGQPVFARVALTGKQLRGRYFYERVGTDIGLHGTLSEAGDFSLSEGPSGRFEGRCEEPTGVLSGVWSKGAKGPAAGSFRLVPIVPGDGPVTPVVAQKEFKKTVKGGAPDDDAGTWECSYKETRIELFGLRDPKVERAMNSQGLEPLFGPVLDASDFKDVEGCEQGLQIEMSRDIGKSFRDFVTITTSGWSMMQGAAHPNNAIGFTRSTWDLRTARPVLPKDVLARDISDKLVACVGKEQTDAPPYNGWGTLSDNLALTETGVHFFATGFPPYVASFTGMGPTIPYAVLLREGYLRKDSPVKRAWESVTPAAKDLPFCPDSWD
jgi:hypothetical protein